MTTDLFDERDARFVLFDVLGVEGLAQHERFRHVDRETVELLLGEAKKLAEQRLFPLNTAADRVGVRLDGGAVRVAPGVREAYREFVANGWLTQSDDAEIGGQALPKVVTFATHEMFLGANFPFMCFVNLTHDAAKLIELFGDDAQKGAYLARMYGGEWTGTMCLTEANGGSDVGAVSTRAMRTADGSYRLKGQKIYITNGDHDIAENIVHLVLARIHGDPDGTEGLSIFIVPKRRLNDDGSAGVANDVTCVGLWEKMGLHASPTTSLSFGDNDDCHAYLLGEPRQGIRIMFHMMNQSRLEVGLYGLGTCEVAYRLALDYARERRQGRGLDGQSAPVPIIEHPDVRRNLLTMKAYVEGMRAMLLYCAYAIDRASVAEGRDERQRWQGIVDLLVPIVKAHATEKAVELCALAMQIFGGAGYMREYAVEQYLRDAKVACIIEGTTGIQGMDFALRKVRMGSGSVFEAFLDGMDPVIEEASALPSWACYAEQVRRTRDAVKALPGVLAGGAEQHRLRDRLLSATPFLDATSDLFVAYFLLWSATVAERKLKAAGGLAVKGTVGVDEPMAEAPMAHLLGKLHSARHFIANLLPAVDGRVKALTWMEASACTMPEASF